VTCSRATMTILVSGQTLSALIIASHMTSGAKPRNGLRKLYFR
jgi:hypothetical protein